MLQEQWVLTKWKKRVETSELVRTLLYQQEIFRSSPEIPLSQYLSYALNPTPHIAHLGHADPVVWHITFGHVLVCHTTFATGARICSP